MGVLYEHWRLDTNECFYIGKASGKKPYARAYDLNRRNKHHRNIVEKLHPLGLIEVRTTEFPDISKDSLNNLEILMIAHWKAYIGAGLVNASLGGDGGNTYAEKSSEELKEIFAKISRAHANRTTEERARFAAEVSARKKAEHEAMSPEKKAEILSKNIATNKATRAAKTPEQEAERKAKEKLAKSARTPEQEAERKAKEKLAKSARTPEQEAERKAKEKATKSAKSCEEREFLRTKNSAGVKAARARETDAQKISRVEKWRETRRRNKEIKLAAAQAAKIMEN